MNTADIVKYIVTGSLSRDELNSIVSAVNETRKLSRAQSKAIAKATITNGMLVKTFGLSPKYINGIEGVISGGFNKTRTRASIRVTKSNTSMYPVGSTLSGIPIQCFEVLKSPVAGSSITADDSNALATFLGS